MVVARMVTDLLAVTQEASSIALRMAVPLTLPPLRMDEALTEVSIRFGGKSSVFPHMVWPYWSGRKCAEKTDP